jgi:hypothetical protein
MKKNKSTRRKAINCNMVKASESNPGYFKYVVTIQEPNGNIVKQPAYGVDMQDAISRLIWNERTEMVEKVTNKPSILNVGVVLVPLILIIPSALSIYYNNPYPILGAIIVILSTFGGGVLLRKYLDKGNFSK